MVALRNQLAREVSGLWRLDRATDEMVIEPAARLLSAGVWHVHTTDSLRGLIETDRGNQSTATRMNLLQTARQQRRTRPVL